LINARVKRALPSAVAMVIVSGAGVVGSALRNGLFSHIRVIAVNSARSSGQRQLIANLKRQRAAGIDDQITLSGNFQARVSRRKTFYGNSSRPMLTRARSISWFQGGEMTEGVCSVRHRR
jgi:hypothetical protein